MLKYSVIGTSWITEMFINAAKKSKEAELLSIYSRREESARAFAAKNGAVKGYTNLDEMLADDSDFIYIASPNNLHFEHVMKCIDHHKHVFCEKPMAFTEFQVQEIYRAANEKNVFVFEGYRHLYSPNYRKLQASLKEVGKIRSVLFPYLQYSSRYDQFKDGSIPNVFSKDFAGGVLMDLGVYPLSMTIDLFGNPNDLDYIPLLLPNGVDGNGTLVLRYDEFTVTILISKITDSKLTAEIQGEDGVLTINHIAPITNMTLTTRKQKEVTELAGPQEELDMVYEIQAFSEMVKTNDRASFEKWMMRSAQVAKCLEKARHQNNILFPGE
ncbi:Gfo/Idh/MocA family protein [Ornithinibacillus xuwenensis]|uniref:Gfo/Idh/MocA family oxidoreductase n=1 Tax=Ornithinibacillus xuwenensis TaxID=3144668 RepID=A0ABU9XML5_9BACI